MINYIWASFIVISIIASFFTGNTRNLSTTILESTTSSMELIINIGAMMCLWSGIMNIAQKSGVTDFIAKLFSPILKKLMPDYRQNKSVLNAVSLNISANMLGLGNAATPLGLEAMRLMKKKNEDTANNSMIIFVIINTASVQLIPTTAIILRQNLGADAPFNILIPVWVTSIFALCMALAIAKTVKNFK